MLPPLASPPRADLPSRLSGLSAAQARLLLATLAALLLLVALAASRAGDPPPAGEGMATIRAGLVSAVLNGGDYYLAAVEALRAADRPADPLAIPLPTLTMIATLVPFRLLTLLLWLLGLATALVWYHRLALPHASATRKSAALLLPLTPLTATLLRPEAALMQETWAGLLVALSLGRHRSDRLIEMVALGLAAALTDQVAIVYLLAMATAGSARRRHDVVFGWGAAIGLFTIVFALHFRAAVDAGGAAPLANGLPAAGPMAAICSVAATVFPIGLPIAIAAPMVVLALVGWAVQRGSTASNVTIVLVAFLLVVAFSPFEGIGEATLRFAPLSLTGLLFTRGMIRHLIDAVFHTRHFSVRRITR